MIYESEIIKKAYKGEISPEIRLYVSNYYAYLFGKEIVQTKCSSCIQDAAIKILIKMNEKRKYLLKAHIPILHKGKWYTQPILTDEIAEKYLKLNPDDKFKFAKIPKEEKVLKITKQTKEESENIKED